jgi:hypothetical protein
MAAKKVKVPASFNAKPVTKLGGKSSPARKPSSPYKPGAVRGGRERLPLVPKPKASAAKPNAPSAKVGPKTYQVSDPWAGPKRASIGNVKGPASSPKRPTGPVRASIGNVKGPATSPKAPTLPKGAAATAGKAASALGKLASRASFVGTALQAGATANSVFNPKSEGNQQLGRALAAVNKRYSGKSGPRFKNPNTGSVASKGAKPKAPMPKGSSAALREKSYASLQKFNVPKPKAVAKPAAPKAPSAPSRSSAPARTPESRPAAKPAAKPKATTNMATESSMSASDIMKGYGMRVNQTFGAESPSTPKKRESLKSQKDDIQRMIEASKKRQGKG